MGSELTTHNLQLTTHMYESPLFWPAYIKDDVLYVLDETLVPAKIKYISVKDVKAAVKVIRQMKTRAFGQFLVVLNTFLLELNPKGDLLKHLRKVATALNNSRPTFPFAEVTGIVVGVAQKACAHGADVKTAVVKTIQGFLHGIRQRRLERVRQLAGSIENGDNILTHCNVSGELAMAASLCLKDGKKISFFATETRPYMQGSKLTAWELQQAGSSVIVVPDNTVGSLMADGLVNKVVIGSDRSAANGDVANKVGSYPIALLAKEFDVPVIVLTQPSNKVKKGQDMPIELRDPKELLTFNGKSILPKGVKGFYPGFDVVPHSLITKAIPIHAGL